MNKRLFRWHRGGLSESLDTTIEVHSIADIRSHILNDFPDGYLHNIRIKEESYDDSARAGHNWKEQHMVIADFENHIGQCLGWCNFVADATPQEYLEFAIKIATEKHAGQVDKGGMPYILHPLRVMIDVQRTYIGMQNKRTYWNMCIAAILHDVVEDTDTSFYELDQYKFDHEIMEVLDLLTKPREEDYAKYILRIAESGNKCALIIKMVDLRDNMDRTRLPRPLSEKDNERLSRYNMAFGKLDDELMRRIENKQT